MILRKRKIRIPLYHQTLEIIVNDKIKKYAAYVLLKKNKIVVHITTNSSVGVVAHEAVHITNEVFKKCMIELDINNDEAYAYLLGWIVTKISKEVCTKKDISQFK